jgi:two-component system response regulator VicR
MINSKPQILILAPPGDLQISLQALLTTNMKVDVLVTSEGSSALNVIARNNPALIILDENLPFNNVPKLVRKIKTNWPKVGCLVLVNDSKEQQKIVDAGADQVVIKGVTGGKLVAKIKKQILDVDQYQLGSARSDDENESQDLNQEEK